MAGTGGSCASKFGSAKFIFSIWCFACGWQLRHQLDMCVCECVCACVYVCMCGLMYLCTSWIRVAAEYIYSRSAAVTRSAAVDVDVAVAFRVGQRPYQSLPALKAFVLLSEWAWLRPSLTHTHTKKSIKIDVRFDRFPFFHRNRMAERGNI